MNDSAGGGMKAPCGAQNGRKRKQGLSPLEDLRCATGYAEGMGVAVGLNGRRSGATAQIPVPSAFRRPLFLLTSAGAAAKTFRIQLPAARCRLSAESLESL